MRQYLLPCLFGLFFLCGSDMPKDPIVGTWTLGHNDVEIICNSDGTGVQRFDRNHFYELNKTYEGVETKIKWKKKSQNTYVFYYLYPNKISTEEGVRCV